MNIRIFQSFKGDCLLIEDKAGKHRILCDGGTPAAMKTFIAEDLSQVDHLDLVYISHIDQDHIGGVLTLLESALAWKAHDAWPENEDRPREPKVPRAPAIKALWHNGFRDLITRNAGRIEELLAASAPALQASHVPALVRLGRVYADIATSIPEALKVSRLVRPDLLDIPLNRLAENPEASGKLLMARSGQQPEFVGSLKVTIIGPTDDELRDLREGWDNWLRVPKNRDAARDIRDRYALALSQPFSARENPLDLSDWNGVPYYEGVTAPNVASLVLLVEEDGKSILLTGDSHPDKILAGLEQAERFEGGAMHLDVLKFPHHGSANNMTDDFGRKVSADNYVFCGNGEHTNPEIDVLDAVLASRVGQRSKRAKAPKARNRPFTFWFNTTSASQKNRAAVEQMKLIEEWADDKCAEFSDRFRCRFVEGNSTSLVL